jgi:hypothetical protein
MTVRQPGSVAPTNHNQGKDIMSSPNSKKRKARAAIAEAVAAGAGGTGIGLQYGLGAAEASAATDVVVDTKAELEAAVADAKAGTVIRVKAGTYYPSATLKSQNSGTANARITLEPYGNGADGIADPTQAAEARGAGGDLPAVTFLTAGSTAIGATMTYLS